MKLKKILFICYICNTLLSANDYEVTLTEAIDIALMNNKNIEIAKTSIDIAKTQYKQAMSGHYPQVDLEILGKRVDEASTFEMRGSTTVDNTQTIAMYNGLSDAAIADGDLITSGTYANIAANTPSQIQLPINIDAKLMNRDTIISRLNFALPLYTGGKVTAITKQASLTKDIAKNTQEKTKNQVIFDVKQYYYGFMLAKKLKKLTSDTLERMRLLSQLTERLYKGGSLNVKKTDYLRSKLSVNFIESLYQKMNAQEGMAQMALANAMGLSFKDSIIITEEDFKTPVVDEEFESLLSNAYKFNPDYNSLKLAFKIKELKIDEVKSDYLPQVAFLADAQYVYNDYEYGIINDTNKKSWSIGVGISWSLFNGMRTSNELREKQLEKLQLENQNILLKEGIALQIKQALLAMSSSYKEYMILSEATKTAQESRELNTRAYQEDLVETKDVIEAQIFESLTKADFYRTQYDYALARANINLIIGTSIDSVLQER